MESTNYNMQYHQPWMVNHLYYKDYSDLVHPMRNPISWKQVWNSGTEPLHRETYDSYVKPVRPQQIYRYNSTLQTRVNEAHNRCLPQHLPSASSGVAFDHHFPIQYNPMDNIPHKDVLEEVTSQWITHGTELIKVATVPISNSLLKAPWNDMETFSEAVRKNECEMMAEQSQQLSYGNAAIEATRNFSEAVRNYECEMMAEQSQQLSYGNAASEATRNVSEAVRNYECEMMSSEATRDTERVEHESVEDDAPSSESKTEDLCPIELSSSDSDESSVMEISETIQESSKDDKGGDCFSPDTAPTKALQSHTQDSEEACCTEEESNFLLIDDRGIPYTVFKEDYMSSLQEDDPDDPRRLHYCPICFRSFLYLSDLERHSITHSERKPYDCKVCGKTFKRSSHLQRHKHIHTGERPYICTVCRKGFRESGELQRHQRVHTGEKPYQCEICYVRFTERNTLRRHTKRKHTIQALLRQDAAGSTDWEAKLMRSILDDSAL
ncbi:zinc finger and BTB domain-containing protein 49-like [Hyperolius riggenbachi]|uniref:zinc finger and BTB domain-containing protein 49-like n=1 Tax=Hyperolius riggenbachi TaxID=752182 RepID=UPI0035A29799